MKRHVLLQQRRFEEAISALQTAVQKEPENVFSVAALIYGLGHAGRKEEAKRHLDQLMKKYEYTLETMFPNDGSCEVQTSQNSTSGQRRSESQPITSELPVIQERPANRDRRVTFRRGLGVP
jgi:tetratricopeptide (TPR) repeat protein